MWCRRCKKPLHWERGRNSCMFPTAPGGEKLCAKFLGHIPSAAPPPRWPSPSLTPTRTKVVTVIAFVLHPFLVGAVIAMLNSH
jgi:hypothetical protein